MEENNEKRMAGDYEILYAIHIGDREVVVGENPNDANGQRYMTAFCQSNELFAQYTDVLLSEDYPEIVKCFGERVAAQAEKTRVELLYPEMEGIDKAPLTAKDCTPITGNDNIEGKVVVIKPEVLRREYQTATRQIMLCEGGFGSHPNARGSACFCHNLYSGTQSRYERHDILGIIEPDALPAWAKAGLERIRQEQARKKSNKEAR